MRPWIKSTKSFSLQQIHYNGYNLNLEKQEYCAKIKAIVGRCKIHNNKIDTISKGIQSDQTTILVSKDLRLGKHIASAFR